MAGQFFFSSLSIVALRKRLKASLRRERSRKMPQKLSCSQQFMAQAKQRLD
jgi:hypothetical protein